MSSMKRVSLAAATATAALMVGFGSTASAATAEVAPASVTPHPSKSFCGNGHIYVMAEGRIIVFKAKPGACDGPLREL